jgi:hypothetical protein
MIRRTLTALALVGALAAFGLPSTGLAAKSKAPAWALTLTPMPAKVAEGDRGGFLAIATNVGAKATSGTATFTITLPAGLKPTEVVAKDSDPPNTVVVPTCSTPPLGQVITCTTEGPVNPGRLLSFLVKAEATGSEGEGLEAQASVEGGGAATATSATATQTISPKAAPFGFLPGFSAPASEPNGDPTLKAGAHPYQLTVNLGFPTQNQGEELANSGHPHDIRVNLPRGLLGNPAATPLLCTEAELTSELSPGCPTASQIGMADVTTQIKDPGTGTSPLYNMVPPPGAVAELGFNALGVGIFVHLIVGVRTDSDYGAYATSNDILAINSHPIFNVQNQIWGDPLAASHDAIRSYKCLDNVGTCPPHEPPEERPEKRYPFLTMPDRCDASPLHFEAFADSWEEPGLFHETSYESADLQGGAASLEDCADLTYEPTIRARPTINATDSPSGLEFNLHQPQPGPEEETTPGEEVLEGRATGTLKDTTVTFPAGMVINPSQATGLGACTEAQIGFVGKEGGALRFTKAPQSCPSAAKIGSLEASSPLLAEYNDEHEVERNPETEASIPRPLHGSLYIAQPFANPFNKLVATYLAIEDEKTGIIAKLAGEGELNATTGQVTVRFSENPELPIEDIRVKVFGGDRGSFITPPTCASQQTNAQLVPWGAPETPTAEKSDSFALTTAPGGGACPATEAQMPNAPVLKAGTLQPQAAKYSPLTFKLSRNDGSQRIAAVDATLPSGLIAKLAGVGQCPEANIAKAISREHPNQGALEQADPSCPSSSEVGTVDIAAGAGPNPFRTSGHVYLAGPYKGAPLSVVVIAPAVAGPFDLGAVVVRARITLEPETALVHAVTDPLPQILDGVPVDLRAATMHLSRKNFILNPTSCSEKQFTGTVISSLGQAAPISDRFQVGGCKSLPYKPTLSARLFGPTTRGGHPRLKAVFTAKPGEANTKRISFALPHSEFIDQAHFRTICTRVQFAAKACPAGSVYGNAKVLTPLLDTPLEGPVYLRSSSHPLPDAVFALHGPPSEPVEVVLDGRIDSVNGGVRVTFASVPDAPVSKAIVNMQGGKKGLFQNSTNICAKTQRATLKLDAQNGKTWDTRPKLKAGCGKSGKKKRVK